MVSSPSEERGAGLETLARVRFPDLTRAEVEILRAAPKGEVALCSPDLNARNVGNDPSMAASWGTERQIRAELIRWICVDRDAKAMVDPLGIQIFAAKISGALNLFYVSIPFPLVFHCCSLDGELNLRYAEISGINFEGTWVHSISGDGVQVKNHIFLRNGFHARGQVRLPAARIGGTLECDGGTFENAPRLGMPDSGIALVADGAIVNGGVFLRRGFRAVGEVRLMGAQVGGYVDCTHATFKNPPQNQIGRAGKALSADGMLVKGSVLLGMGFHAEGEVRLLGAQVEGNLDLGNAVLSNPGRPDILDDSDALVADRIVVKGGVFLGNGFVADGEVRLLGAQIDGDLDCAGGKFRARVRTGTEVRSRALSAHTVTVQGNVFLRYGFHAEGEVGFPGARIAGNLECTRGAFDGDVNLETASIGGALLWRDIVDPQRARLDLMSASIGTLDDSSESWPEPGKLLLAGLVYGSFSGGAPRDAKRRLDWLARQESFAPQPFRQVSKVLRDEGDVAGANRALFEMERLRRIQMDHAWYRRPWSLIYRLTVGYGYYPERSLLFLLVLVVLGSAIYGSGYAAGSIAPVDKDAYSSFKRTSQLAANYERFQPFIYSVENSVPLVKLGQVDRWQPDPNLGWECRPSRWVPRGFCQIVAPVWLRWLRWAQIGLGWFFTTMGLAAVAGIVRRD